MHHLGAAIHQSTLARFAVIVSAIKNEITGPRIVSRYTEFADLVDRAVTD